MSAQSRGKALWTTLWSRPFVCELCGPVCGEPARRGQDATTSTVTENSTSACSFTGTT